MNIFEHLIFWTVVAFGSVWVVVSYVELGRKIAAKRRFISLLAAPDTASQLRKLWDEIMSDGVATLPELKRLIAALEKASEALPAEDRARVAECLRQQSVFGQARYAANVINKAGIAQGPIAIPVAA